MSQRFGSLIIMKSCHVVHAIAIGCLLGFLATSMPTSAASSPTPPASAPRRLTVADFMGTWKVFAKSGKDSIPAFEKSDQAEIGKTVTFSPKKVIDETYPRLVMAYRITNNPSYIVEYKRLYPDTAYPNIPWIENPYPYSGGVVIFKVGYFSKTEKKVLYTDLMVGSDNKSFPFALTSAGDISFYLCKLNPKTGQCQDHP